MSFIMVTEVRDGSLVYVNADHIVSIRSNGSNEGIIRTILGKTILTRESNQQIIHSIKEEKEGNHE